MRREAAADDLRCSGMAWARAVFCSSVFFFFSAREFDEGGYILLDISGRSRICRGWVSFQLSMARCVLIETGGSLVEGTLSETPRCPRGGGVTNKILSRHLLIVASAAGEVCDTTMR